MALFGTMSIENYPIAPGAKTLTQPQGITVTFTTPPTFNQTDTITYTGALGSYPGYTGPTGTVTFALAACQMSAGDVIYSFRRQGVTDAYLDQAGRIVLPGATTVSATTNNANQYIGF